MQKGTSIFLLVSMYMVSCGHYPKMIKKNANSDEKETLIVDSSKKLDVGHMLSDTAKYAKGIMDNKEKYIDKPFGILLDDLNIPPKSYFIGNSRQDVNIAPYIEIHFDDLRTTSRKIENIDDLDNPVSLQIIWKVPVSSANARVVRLKSTSPGNWQAPEQEFYSKQVVGDIVYHFNSRK